MKTGKLVAGAWHFVQATICRHSLKILFIRYLLLFEFDKVIWMLSVAVLTNIRGAVFTPLVN